MERRELADPGAIKYRQRLWWGLAVIAVIVAYFLLSKHGAHVVVALPWLLLLACAFMHLFMHRGRGGRAGHQAPRPEGWTAQIPQNDRPHEHQRQGCC